MINYVVGFAFDAKKERVVLIKKNRGPKELIGKLNGVGGKIEDHESSFEAMSREFFEETGVSIPDFCWFHQGAFSGAGWSVKVFAACTDEILKAKTMEDEVVHILRVRALPLLESFNDLCHHVPLLVGLCLNPMVKRFSFEEE